MIPVIEVDEQGNLHTLYTDEIDLFAIGRVTNVRKASNVEFNELSQKWEVLSLGGKVLYSHSNREHCINWEIEAFQPGGEYYESR